MSTEHFPWRPAPSPFGGWAPPHRSPSTRSRPAALSLGTSALDAMVARCGDRATRLVIEWDALVAELPALGPVLGQTANAGAVLEMRGVYAGLAGTVRITPIDPIDVTSGRDRPGICFAVREGDRRALQIFDRFGGAAHRVVLEDGSRIATFETLVARHGRAAMPAPANLRRRGRARPDVAMDVAALRESWGRLESSDAVDELRAATGITRRHAYRLVGREWAWPVARRSLRAVLAAVVADGVSIRTRVGNRAVVQSSTGCVERLAGDGSWLVARARTSILRVREHHVDSAWVVSVPAPGGPAGTLELLDAAGEPIVALTGTPHDAERWSRILSRLPGA